MLCVVMSGCLLNLRYEWLIIHWCLIKRPNLNFLFQLSPGPLTIRNQEWSKGKIPLVSFHLNVYFFNKWFGFLNNDDGWVELSLEFHYDVCHGDNYYWLWSDIHTSWMFWEGLKLITIYIFFEILVFATRV